MISPQRTASPHRVFSRHRLPRPYRVGLTVMWIAPLVMFVVVMVAETGLNPALLDPRFLLPALLMLLPAAYVWQEGIDLLPGGVYRRIHLPQFYPDETIARLYYDTRDGIHVLTLWDAQGRKLVECRAAHLTDFPALLAALEARIPVSSRGAAKDSVFR
jgi:hypothetical protein